MEGRQCLRSGVVETAAWHNAARMVRPGVSAAKQAVRRSPQRQVSCCAAAVRRVQQVAEYKGI